jgi:hypothetical protein
VSRCDCGGCPRCLHDAGMDCGRADCPDCAEYATCYQCGEPEELCICCTVCGLHPCRCDREETMSEERTVRLVREVEIKVDGRHCADECRYLDQSPLVGLRGRSVCYLGYPMPIGLRLSRLSPYRPIRCKTCVEGEVKP